MKIGAMEEYGLRCLVQMARHSDRQLGIAEIAKAESLSLAYAGKLLSRLRQGGLVTSVRGVKGGYALALPVGRISLARVMEALTPIPRTQKNICRQFPGRRRECVHFVGHCSIRTVWSAIYKNMWALLAKTTLEDLLKEQEKPALALADPAPWGYRKQRSKIHAVA
ncbi:MAG: Rrf2 family transcriptional regulator [Elusimicrobiota bacterium]